jgi:hypothetical protein
MTAPSCHDQPALDEAFAAFDRALQRIGVTTRPGRDDVAIAERERELGLEIPAPLKALYRRFDGVDLGAVSNEAIRFWPLKELRPAGANEAVTFGACLVFADFLLSSIEYGIAMGTGSVVLLNGAASQLVADDLPGFVAKCAGDDRSLYGTGSPKRGE